MSRRRRAVIGGVLAALVVALASAASVWAAIGGGSGSSESTGVQSPEVVRSPENVPNTGISLDPVAPDFKPTISASQALDLAKQQTPVAWQVKSVVTPRLAVLTDWNDRMVDTGALVVDHVPVWIVRVQGVCVPSYGPGLNPAAAKAAMDGEATPPPSLVAPPECAGQEINVVIDAQTGRYLRAYSFR